MAAQLPGTPAERRDVIKSYYSGYQAANRPTKAYESSLFRAAAEQTASVYAVFGGQRNIEEYSNELREIFRVYGRLVGNYLVYCAATLVTFLGFLQRQGVFQGTRYYEIAER